MTDGRCQKLAAAQFEKAAVTDPMTRRPLEDGDRVALGDPRPEQLAGLVPVDQKDKGRAERLEKFVAILIARDRIAPSDEIEHAAFREPGHALALKTAPVDREGFEQFGEEPRARQMDVRVGDGHGIRRNGNDDDMRIGFADIVLDGEALAGSCRSRRETRMAEFQFTGRVDPAHEGFDRKTIIRPQSISMGAGDDLFGMRGGKTIERLMQIHDQLMQAVVLGAGNRGEACDLHERDVVRRSDRYRFLQPREARERAIARRRVTGADGARHLGHVVPDGSAQSAEARRRYPSIAAWLRAIDQSFHCQRIKTGGPAFGGQIERRTAARRDGRGGGVRVAAGRL